MKFLSKYHFLFVVLFLVLIFLFVLNISIGKITIPFADVIRCLTGYESIKAPWEYILLNYRLPKAIVAILAGVSLSISGLLMQTFFRNPLAGPYVLGLSSGSSLGVALVVLGSGLIPSFFAESLLSSYGIMLASCLGSFLVMVLLLLVSNTIRDTASILIVGLMFSSFTSAIVTILTYFSTAEQLQKFTFWSMGNLGSLSWEQIALLFMVVLLGLLLSFLNIKSLDALLLGENYAKSMGINFKKTKFQLIIATSILAGSIHAFVGPIAFIGLAVPHMVKLLFQNSSHKILFWGSVLFGGILMLFCDLVSQLPSLKIVLPINAITSIIGAPVVIWLLIRKRVF